ncbi:MAG: hypothetical protein LAT84_11695 [Balneolia bacterium]|nr:hypothetical protein [Balneolia bacterium]
MKRFSTSQLLIAVAGAFAGGVVISWLSSPCSGAENRKWISDSTSGIKSKVKESGREIKSRNFPDLYEATEELGLTDEDVITGNRD